MNEKDGNIEADNDQAMNIVCIEHISPIIINTNYKKKNHNNKY